MKRGPVSLGLPNFTGPKSRRPVSVLATGSETGYMERTLPYPRTMLENEGLILSIKRITIRQ